MPFHRFGHGQLIPIAHPGDMVTIGQTLGKIGHTGNAEGAHLHYDIFKVRPANFYEYTSGLSKAQVASIYMDPSLYMKNDLPAPNTRRTGYTFLQWTGNLFHPGADINSLNDEGRDFKSPVNGQVVFVSSAGPGDHGWGNMIVVEESVAHQYDHVLAARLSGRFLLAVESHGRLWYVDQNGYKHDVGITPEDCAIFLREIADKKIPLGITNSDLDKIPLA